MRAGNLNKKLFLLHYSKAQFMLKLGIFQSIPKSALICSRDVV